MKGKTKVGPSGVKVIACFLRSPQRTAVIVGRVEELFQ